MSSPTVFEGRVSDSPYIDTVWRGRSGSNYNAVCPADEHWNLFFMKYQDRMRIAVEGPLTKAKPKTHPEGVEWLVIRFKLGVFMPYIPVKNLLDGDALLPEATRESFWLNSSVWQLPDYNNVETFIDRLVHNDVLLRDPVVNAVMQDHPHDVSFRTIRRRFLLATGLTHGAIRQIERARQAVALLEQGVSILDTVYQAGYADQPHLTRSLKRFIGITPAQIVREPA
jgi:hypothetical protein